jgi:hypothetical protein
MVISELLVIRSERRRGFGKLRKCHDFTKLVWLTPNRILVPQFEVSPLCVSREKYIQPTDSRPQAESNSSDATLSIYAGNISPRIPQPFMAESQMPRHFCI